MEEEEEEEQYVQERHSTPSRIGIASVSPRFSPLRIITGASGNSDARPVEFLERHDLSAALGCPSQRPLLLGAACPRMPGPTRAIGNSATIFARDIPVSVDTASQMRIIKLGHEWCHEEQMAFDQVSDQPRGAARCAASSRLAST